MKKTEIRRLSGPTDRRYFCDVLSSLVSIVNAEITGFIMFSTFKRETARAIK